MTVAQKVKRARGRLFSQGSLGKKIGLSRDQMAKRELGETEFSAFELDAIANALRVPREWFEDGKNTAPPYYSEREWLQRQGSESVGTTASPLGLQMPARGVGRCDYPLRGVAGAAAFAVRNGDDPDAIIDFSDSFYALERFFVEVSGNSQFPYVRHRDYVLVQPSTQLVEGVFTILEPEPHEFLVKIPKRTKNGSWALTSENPEFDPLEVSDETVVIGYAVGVKRITPHFEIGNASGLSPRDWYR